MPNQLQHKLSKLKTKVFDNRSNKHRVPMIGGVAKFVERAADKANDPVFGVTFNNLRKQTVENERDSS